MSTNENIQEGFRLLKTEFVPPPDAEQLNPSLKRKITICNLFLNHRLAIKDIARILDESPTQAVNTLIEQGIIEERRGPHREQPKHVRAARAARSLLGSRLGNNKLDT
jgi:hypothetical protein